MPFLAARSPSLALKLAPQNASAIVSVFNSAITSGAADGQEISGWIDATQLALRSDPLNARALRMLAYVSGQDEEDLPRVERLLSLSERVSRRDPLAQMWLIENAVRDGDVDSALRHYDRALTTRPSSAGQLVPVLASALREPLVRQALVPYVRAERPWIEPMLSVAIDQARDLDPVVAFFRSYGGARAVPGHAELEARLLERLAKAGRIDDAVAYAASAGADLKAFGITESTIDERFRPLVWTFYQGATGEVSAGPDGELAVSVDSNTRIVAATRVVSRPAGSYTLVEAVSYADSARAPEITWTAYCRTAEGSRQFWTRTLPVVPDARQVEAPLQIPSGCSGVQFDLEVTGADAIGRSEVTISNLTLEKR
ncbi:hypothetical protein [Altericroceibacterium xinjiangense]|uniref:hypothetical protein n=1 Tax=Altericroceibacterium xinjiangense TaxID=762261 RepID=UPI0013DE90E4|nr:hypothetical protein [Altericroceibacterium xinjiangense]